GLARWLIDRDNPLTARVTVNRLWGQLFGIGLVETEEDFGTQGELPSHPELLDWLAVEFMEPSRATPPLRKGGLGGVASAETDATAARNTTSPSPPFLRGGMVDGTWDSKRFLKLLVMSATYRQSALVTADRLEKDPRNRLLSRGPRFRLEAEMVRDQA